MTPDAPPPEAPDAPPPPPPLGRGRRRDARAGAGRESTFFFSQVYFTESFEALTPETAALKYAPLVGEGPYVHGTYSHVTGPYVGRAARFAGAGNALEGAGAYASGAEGPVAFDQLTVGFAANVRLSAPAPAGSALVLVQAMLADSDAEGPTIPLQTLSVGADGTLAVALGGAGGGSVLAASAAGAVPRGVWFHLEYRTALAAPTDPPEGSVAVRVDGVEVLRVEALATVETEPNRMSHYRWGNVGPVGNATVVDVDDVCYYAWGYENDPEEWLGPCQVTTLFPVGPGTSTELSLTGAPSNWQANAEVPPDGDTSHVAKAGGTHPVDMYQMTPLPGFAEALPGGAIPQLLGWYVMRAESAGGSMSSRTGYRRLGFAGGGGVGADLAVLNSITLPPDYRYVPCLSYPVGAGDSLAYLNSLEAGYATEATLIFGATNGAYRATQTTVDFVHSPGPPLAGGGRTRVFWVP